MEGAVIDEALEQDLQATLWQPGRRRGHGLTALTRQAGATSVRSATMAIELVPLCTIDLVLAEDHIIVGEGPSGLRVVAEAESLTVTGERLSGRQKGRATADWLTIVGTVGTVDVRSTFETDDGALVYLTYGGRMDLSQGQGGAPIYSAPRFETGDERYAWLNLVQAVGKGTLDGHTLSYEVAEVR